MKIRKLFLKNFKGYKEAEITFNDISLIVGKNDAGKSTILQALDIFFNKKDALNKHSDKSELFYKNTDNVADEIIIECHFDIQDEEIKLGGEDKDVSINETNLLTSDGYFVLGYKYSSDSICKSGIVSESYIKCNNYDISENSWSNKSTILEQMNKKDLDNAIKELNIYKPNDADGRENHWKRVAIEEYLRKSNIVKTENYISLGIKSDKYDRILPVLNKLPKFKLFSNDNANSMGDKENSAVIENEIKNIIAEQMKEKLEEINKEMQAGMSEKLQKLNETYRHFFSFLGDDCFSLKDGIPEIKFKTSGIIDNKGLNIENRGSGFRRLALLSLHLSAHQAEEYSNIIFGIEEPETSQNPYNQKGIIEAVYKLIEKQSQVIITTHSPAVAKEFHCEDICYTVIENNNLESAVCQFSDNNTMFDSIINLLGIMPLDTHNKKLIVFVEGLHDEAFLKKVAQDIFQIDDILFIPVGGKNNLNGYIASDVFKSLRLPYGGFIDGNVDRAKEKMISALANLGYKDNVIEAKLEDISKYLANYKGVKKGINEKIREMNTVKESDINEIEEIRGWFAKFANWKV